MILSDAHRFAFVHIPKCAGVSVKGPLRAIDSTQGLYSRIADHPALGRIHWAHVTLADLAIHFPDAFEKVVAYRSFAVARDPQDRFVSAMFQRLREFRGFAQSAITADVIEEQAAEVIRYLERGPERLDLEHVHFNRQVDYVDLDGRRIVDDIFPIERMDAIIAYVEQHSGVTVEGEQAQNRSTELKAGALKPIVRALKAPYFALVPDGARNRLRRTLERSGFYEPVEKQRMIREGGRLQSFIKAYYAADFDLHHAARFTEHAPAHA